MVKLQELAGGDSGKLTLLQCVGILLVLAFLPSVLSAKSGDTPILYDVLFNPEASSAQVTISIENAQWLKKASFYELKNGMSHIVGNGSLTQKNNRWTWIPPQKNAQLRYQVNLRTKRKNGGYDAYLHSLWTLARGEDLLPSFRVIKTKGVNKSAHIRFQLPAAWSSVNSGWQRVDKQTFFLQEAGRALPRPKGWVIAGDLGTRHEQFGSTLISISAPKGHNFRQMEALAFIGMVWPQFETLFTTLPDKILITGAGDPMWRGGLSSPTSLYMHTERPLVSENGTSTLIHELIHVITRMHGGERGDWIVEGIAEFYSVELLFRAGAFSRGRRADIFAGLEQWGKSVSSLARKRSSGAVTARAAVLFEQLDKEIQSCTHNAKNLDWLTRQLVRNKSVTLSDLRDAFAVICESPSKVLKTSLVE